MKTIFTLTLLVLLTCMETTTNAQVSRELAMARTQVLQTEYHHAECIRIAGRSDKAITLNWAPFAGDVSHYIIERSFDGRAFSAAALFFSGDWILETGYRYTDKLKSAYSGPLYYRLRIVHLDGTFVHTTPVRTNDQLTTKL